MEVSIYQVDAFTGSLFAGNPAAVCPLREWLPDDLLQNIAAENNLSETAFFRRRGSSYELRWFSPLQEVELCGHATLATAHVLMTILEPHRQEVTFETTMSGPLSARREGELLVLDLPSRPPQPAPSDPDLGRALGRTPGEVLTAQGNALAVFADEATVRSLSPDFSRFSNLFVNGVIATARGEHVDFVSRYFAPAVGIPEDPVTGSSHCSLVPYWAGKLGQKKLHAWQVSQRGGELFCTDMGGRVHVGGQAVLYLKGTLFV